MSALAKAVLDFENEHPGEPDLDVNLPGAAWAHLVELARRELGLKTAAPSSAPPAAPEIPPSPRAAGFSLCGALDGKPGKKNPPCFHEAGHPGAHSNGYRIWRERKERASR